MKSILFVTIFTVVLFLFSSSTSYSYSYLAPPDSVSAEDSIRISDSIQILYDSIIINRPIVIYIGNLNFDRYPDTVLGKQWQQFSYMPTVIRWGQKHDTITVAIDSFHYVPDSLKVPQSEIKYPVWGNMKGNISFEKINKDTIMDMMLAFTGVSLDTVPQKYKRILAVFGQDYLDTMHIIDISGIDSFQVHPFIALNLLPGQQLISPGQRDISKGTSYILPRLNFPVRDTSGDSTAMHSTPGSLVSGVAEKSHSFRVYPNPAAYFITVEAVTLPQGTYFIEINNSAGLLVSKQEVQVPSNGELLRRLDLRSIATGYYLLKIRTNEKMLGAYQILVIH